MTSRPALSPPGSPVRRVRRPAPLAAVPHLPPIHSSLVQPAVRDAQTGAVIVQHPASCRFRRRVASATAEDAPQPLQQNVSSASEPADATANGQPDSGTTSKRLQHQQTVPGSCQQPAAAEAYRIECLWMDEHFVARRLLALVALAKQLMTLPAPGCHDDAQASQACLFCHLTSASSFSVTCQSRACGGYHILRPCAACACCVI